jgi:hypothetical protein
MHPDMVEECDPTIRLLLEREQVTLSTALIRPGGSVAVATSFTFGHTFLPIVEVDHWQRWQGEASLGHGMWLLSGIDNYRGLIKGFWTGPTPGRSAARGRSGYGEAHQRRPLRMGTQVLESRFVGPRLLPA